jgi:hypothetical protein
LASRVFEFCEHHRLTPDFLRQVSLHQVGPLAARFDALDLDPRIISRDRAVPLHDIAGFLGSKARAPQTWRARSRREGYCRTCEASCSGSGPRRIWPMGNLTLRSRRWGRQCGW